MIRRTALCFFVIAIMAGSLALAADAPSVSAAEATFKAKCTMCHGPDGGGKTMMGEKLNIRDMRSEEVQKQSDADINGIITNGKGKMSPYKGKLSDEQIAQLVTYIRELGKKK